MVSPNSALLSPRGGVLENGMPRFFRRLAEGVFDEGDIRRRALLRPVHHVLGRSAEAKLPRDRSNSQATTNVSKT
jgi:predicted esterase